jgi:hypothetical protein
MSGAFLKILR